MAEDPYAITPGDDPGKLPNSGLIPSEADLELVAPITNPTRRAISDVEVYLEHLGLSDAQFVPRTWNAGRLAPNEVFSATWPVQNHAIGGSFEGSIVVGSRGTNPVRLQAPIKIASVRSRDYRQSLSASA